MDWCREGLYGKISKVNYDGKLELVDSFENLHRNYSGKFNEPGEYFVTISTGKEEAFGDHVKYTLRFVIKNPTGYKPTINNSLLNSGNSSYNLASKVYDVTYQSKGTGKYHFIYPLGEEGYIEALSFAERLEGLKISFDEANNEYEKLKNGEMVYSKLLQKPFNNIAELRAAEDEFNKAHEAELKAKEEKKAAAKVVEDAATLRITAEIEAKKQKAEAYQHYLETCDAIDAKVNETREAESKALKDFCDKYGSFHTTLTIGNTTYNYSYEVNSYVDPFKRLIETFWF